MRVCAMLDCPRACGCTGGLSVTMSVGDCVGPLRARVCVRACAWVVRIIECLRWCIARRVEPVLSRELHHTINIYCYCYLTVSYMSSAAIVKRWCFSTTAKPRSLKLCTITTFLELYISQVT